MSALVKTIKSRLTDDTIYPITKADAVYMGSSTVTTVEGQINNICEQIDDINDIIGSESMETTATTITGAIAQHELDINTLNNNSAVYLQHSSLNNWAVRKRGNVVFLYIGNIISLAANSSASLGVIIPAGYRPPQGAGFTVCQRSATFRPIAITISADGNVTLYNYGAAISVESSFVNQVCWPV